MAAIDLSLITVGGPCKITDGAAVIYTEGDVTLEPVQKNRAIASSVAGEQDDVTTSMTWRMTGVPKAVWTAGYRGALLPDAYFNFTATGGRIIGAVNRTVTVLGTDGEQYVFTRMGLTQPPNLFLGLGKSLYSQFEYTGFIGQGKALTDADAFYTLTTSVAWSQADYPTTHQEALCSAAWGAVTGWATVFAEEGFELRHELKMDPVYQGNIEVDRKITGYRAGIFYKPQGPSSAQLLSALGSQGTGAGIGSRLSSRANDFVVTGAGISVTGKSMALNRGQFLFGNKPNRHGEWGMITALQTPGTRLVFA
jgi:hypothetical protein